MHGIVSLLEDKYYRLVKDLWAELEKEFAVRGVYVTPYPHFSYQVASHYDTALLEPILRDFASSSSAFQISAGGLGIFTGSSPVLYIPVVRTQELNRFHATLCQEISQAGAGIVDYYHPEHWMPHITIGFGDMNRDNLSQIIRILSERNFNWEITVDNIALIYDTGSKQELRSRFDFGTRAVSGDATVGNQSGHPLPSDFLKIVYEVRERIIRESNGELFEDSTELIRQMREERTKYLMEVLEQSEETE